jgi:hypothetical protein
MDFQSEPSSPSNFKLSHSNSLQKPARPGSLILTHMPSDDIWENNSKTPKPRIKPSLSKQNLLEMLGAQSNSTKTHNLPGLKISIQSPKIALTDFMGKNKISLLKQTGYMDYYHQYRKSTELLKLIEQKSVISFNNLQHHDSIRENSIKGQKNLKNFESLKGFSNLNSPRKGNNKNLEKIEEIIEKCDDLSDKSKKQLRDFKKQKDEMIKILSPKRKKTSRISGFERGLISKQIAAA